MPESMLEALVHLLRWILAYASMTSVYYQTKHHVKVGGCACHYVKHLELFDFRSGVALYLLLLLLSSSIIHRLNYTSLKEIKRRSSK